MSESTFDPNAEPGPPHPDEVVHENKIIRVYNDQGQFEDLTVDQVISQKRNQWKGWLCYAGKSSLYIDYDGFIFGSNCKVGGRLGNIYDGFEPADDWIICPNNFCGCGADVMVPKAVSEDEINLLSNYYLRLPNGESKRIESISKPAAVETAFRLTHLRVQWDMGRRCNYDCSYCWPNVHSKTEKLKDPDVVFDAANMIIKKFGKDRKCAFQFGGGEPTIQPKFLELCEYLKTNGHECIVTTNGSRHHSYWKKLIEYSSVNISVHFEFADLDKLVKNIETMVNKMKELPEHRWLEIKIMTPPNKLEVAQKFRDRLLNIEHFGEMASWSMVPLRHPIINKRLAAQLLPYKEEELNIFQNRL